MRKIIKDFFDEFKLQIKDIRINGFKKQIPNMLTFSRAIAPLIIIPTILLDKIVMAIIELIIFSLTDFFDGKLARKYNLTSSFGVKLDAVCDKIFVVGLIIPTMIKFPILVINLVFEIAISYVNLISQYKNNNPISNMAGKIKTLFLSVTLIFGYVPNIDEKFLVGSSIITLVLQLTALIRYKNLDKLKDKKKG